LARFGAAAEALKAVGDAADDLAIKFEQLYRSDDKGDSAFANFYAYGDLSKASQSEVNDLA